MGYKKATNRTDNPTRIGEEFYRKIKGYPDRNILKALDVSLDIPDSIIKGIFSIMPDVEEEQKAHDYMRKKMIPVYQGIIEAARKDGNDKVVECLSARLKRTKPQKKGQN